MFQQPVQTSIEPVFFRDSEIHAKQFIHRAIQKPLAMHSKLTARLDPSVHDKKPEHLLPTHGFAAFGQSLLPEILQSQLPPQLACHPAVAECARPAQFQPAQLHLQAVDGFFGNLAIVWKQTQLTVSLLLFIKDVQRLQPRRLLAIVDLSQVQHRTLGHLACGQSTILHHAVVPMFLAVLLSIRVTQKHCAQNHRNIS
jgi:hypothetical protein